MQKDKTFYFAVILEIGRNGMMGGKQKTMFQNYFAVFNGHERFFGTNDSNTK